MSQTIRTLNDKGVMKFRHYLASQQSGKKVSPPFDILDDGDLSDSFEHEVHIDKTPDGRRFANRFEFGVYLRDKLAVLDRAKISRNYGLWNWLSLFFFDQLSPPSSDGSRKILADEIYIISSGMPYRQYFRHLVRAPWIAVCEHGENAKVLLNHTDRTEGPLATRGLIFEQLASRQGLLSNRTIIAGAQKLFFDERGGRPRLGVSGHGAGSVRRFAIVVQQLELTFDMRACSPEQFINLLPKEFDLWKPKSSR
jgi:hypothetical protein